jgi:hypothetical protein
MFAGDFAVETTFDVKFTTRRFTTGAPFALASGVISAYPDNSTTQITAGITLSADFDGVTGLNNVRVVATGANGYAAGSSYFLVITTGTVDSVSVVGEVIGSFTLGRSNAFTRLGAPAGASVSADVAAIKTETATILSDTNDIQTRIPAALVSGRIDASVGAMAASVLTATAINADAITAAKIADGAIDAATFAAGAINAAAIADGALDRATFAADTGLQTVRSNTATAGAAGSITLDASASAVDDFYNADLIYITGATGAGQARLISDYVGATKVATITPNWATNPDNTSTFAIFPAGDASVSGTFDANVVSIAADVITATSIAANAITDAKVAADVTIASVTGAVGSVTGNVGGNVTGSVGSVATGGIAAASFAAGAIDAAAIAASAIGASEIAADAITAAKIADGAIDAATFAAGAITATVIATGAIDADALAADAVDEILDDTIGDGTITVRQALRVLVAGMAGKLSGAATTTVTIRNVADSADVVVATVDANGNRTATTVTP